MTPSPTSIPETDYALIPLHPIRANFPWIEHWDPGEWSTLRHQKKGSSPPPKGLEPVSVQFWEGPDGKVIPSKQRLRVTRDARAIWQDMHEKGKHLDTLTKIGMDVLEDFRARMESLHPWLRLCSSHWKADQIWTNHFSGWWSDKKGKQPETLKRERSIEDEAGPSQKKLKTPTDRPSRPKPTKRVITKVHPSVVLSMRLLKIARVTHCR